MHTIVVSDLHLADSEPVNDKNPLWKKFKQKKYFIDENFYRFISKIIEDTKGEPVELVLNGDIFDFDSVMKIPEGKTDYFIKPYEYRTGLNPLEKKSVFKIECILKEHDLWVQSIKKFLDSNKDNRVIFVIGNHDLELNWIRVQEIICRTVTNTSQPDNIKFCEWFYVSEGDTLIEHGHQYDPYCLSLNPINPVIKKNGLFKMRLPFGNLATRFMINNMGLKNPHNDEVFTKTLWEFIKFFFKYEIKTQPFMVFTWFFGAIRTMIYSIGESFLPSLKDPLTLRDKIKDIAKKSNTDIEQVFILKNNHAHPAVRRPFSIIKELWLDRAFLSFFIIWLCWQIFTTSALFADISLYWFFIPLIISTPFFIYYAHGISSDVHNNQNLALQYAPQSARSLNVKRVVLGHTHRSKHEYISGDIEYINTGTWSPIFLDVECEKEISKHFFCWIKKDKLERKACLYLWDKDRYEISQNSKEFFN